jgi:two-component system, OmpR family, alkaline phosphatase synthesis response regulator PhoP
MRDDKHVILYVDDDQDMLDTIRIVLEANGYIMEEALTAEDGLRRYREVNPDFVIVDLMMEEVDAGTNLVKELKLLDNQAPVYMLSSVGDQLNLNVSYSDLGLSGVFQKPVDFETLKATLAEKLG